MRSERYLYRSLQMASALLLDRYFEDPKDELHPVALFGRVMETVEELVWSDTYMGGVRATAMGVGISLISSHLLAGLSFGLPFAGYVSIGQAQLHSTALTVAKCLEEDDLEGAIATCSKIVGRDLAGASSSDVARAAIESVAENTADAVLGPLIYGTFFGVTGVLLYRSINTLDAMFGYKNRIYNRFGWASAKLDDLVNLPVSRLGALVVYLLSSEASRSRVRRAISDAKSHPSPNAGVIEAAFAGCLDIKLGGASSYAGVVEHRVHLGSGRTPDVMGIVEAVKLSKRTSLFTQLLLTGTSLLFLCASKAISRQSQDSVGR